MPYTAAIAVLPILTGAENPVLRRKTTRVPKVTKEVKKLLKDMRDTVASADGGGLAAPQIGVSLRVCLSNIGGKMTPLINPEITWRSQETDIAQEGCLSLPGIWKDIERPVEITLQFLDEEGKRQERRFTGWDARVVQHEVDHLEGVLLVDYLPASGIRAVSSGTRGETPAILQS